ncbi:unnamed protein product [Mytilus edulis]|uniref:Uncharacterized protein n=1 Tax=Mytilus edulis TaxID=6550 RepID=A0A8S3PSA2_MYTED|nr:unnamed protein product [Mytilus edulis]
MEYVIPRMSLIDSLNDVHRSITERDNTHKEKEKSLPDILGITLNSTDMVYILRITGLILRRGGISTIPNKNVYNMYEANPDNLPDSILDQHSKEAGEFLIKKYVANNNLFAFDKTDIPDLSSITGPKTLVQKLKQSKGVTIRRIPPKRQQTAKTEREIKEDKRNKEVAKQSKQINHISSQMNLCQSIVKPDCSKPKVQKSQGIQKALLSILIQTYTNMEQQHLDEDNGKDKLESDGAVILGSKVIPPSLASSTTYATLEFAGIKFSSFAHTGNEYLNYIGKDVIGKIKHQLPLLKHLAICEEKYNFTPDDFKAATRAQRKTNQKQSISHLKTAEEVLSAEKFDKTSLISTTEGKVITSTYLAKNISQLDLKQTITLDIDSELQMTTCTCEKRKCTCTRFCTPIRAVFKEVGGYQGHELLDSIRQNKGEAEMSQVDWLIEYCNSLKPKESCVSIVSSGDIDAVVVHLFAVSHLWPRTENGTFKNEVYVILRKPNQIYDIYNITKIILMIENFTSEKFIGMKIAIILSLGGNDFLPKFYQISHSLTVDLFMREATFREGLVTINTEEGKVVSVNFDADHYTEFIKYLYCPKLYDASKLTYEEVRQMSIKMPTLRSKGVQRNAQLWMPPKSVIQTLAKNVECLIKYYLSAGLHFAPMPEFLVEGCLLKLQSGEIQLWT